MAVAEMPRYWGAGRAVRNLAQPFPLTGMWRWEDEGVAEPEGDQRLDPVYDDGTIVLGTEGCGMYWHLVVTGAHRGHVWLIDESAAVPFGAQFGTTRGQSGFGGWVKHWASGAEWFASRADRRRCPGAYEQL